MVIVFSEKDREVISSKIMDLTNTTFAAITLGQAFANQNWKWTVGFVGILLWLALFCFAMLVRKGIRI